MAYDSSKEIRKVTALLDKNNKGYKVQVCEVTTEGSDVKSADIRVMYTPLDSEEVRPTPKGVRFNTKLIPGVIKGLAEILTAEERAEVAKVITGECVTAEAVDEERANTEE